MTKTKRDSLIDGYVKDVNDGNITVEEALDSLLCYIEDKKDRQIDELKQEIKKHLGGGSEKDELGVRRDEKTKQSGDCEQTTENSITAPNRKEFALPSRNSTEKPCAEDLKKTESDEE